MHKTRTALFTLATAALAFGTAAWWSLATAPAGTLGPGPVDALVVFGSPADWSGDPSPMQLWRVHEGVAEYGRGQAPHIIFSGGPAANPFVESDVMAQEALRLGVPTGAILRERKSRTTIANLRGVTAIMKQNGWTTAELISSADHLPRIAVLAKGAPFRWRLHAAPTPGRSRASTALDYVEEASATLILRTFGSAAEPIIHTIAVVEHSILFLPKWLHWKFEHRTVLRRSPR